MTLEEEEELASEDQEAQVQAGVEEEEEEEAQVAPEGKEAQVQAVQKKEGIVVMVVWGGTLRKWCGRRASGASS